MLIKRALIFLLFVVLLSPCVSAAPTLEFVVVVHKDRKVVSLSGSELRRMFLGKTKKWPDGEAVMPILNPNEDVHRMFTRDLLHKSTAQLKNYWRKRLFSGQSMMPYMAKNSAEVVTYLSENSNAISYLPKSVVAEPLRSIRITP